MTRTLRDYQQQAVDAIRGEWSSGVTRTAVVMATGLGKTDVIAAIATGEARRGGRPLILAHRDKLLDQITERCTMHDPDIPVGRVAAERDQCNRPITVAMEPTLRQAKRRDRLQKPSMVIVDEAHHVAARGYMSVLAWAGSFDHVPTLGVTATLVRGRDAKGTARLGDVWQSAPFVRDTVWAIKNGWLVRPRGRCVVVDHLDLDAAKVSRGDYTDDQLGEMVSQDVDQIVKAWLEHAADRKTVAFTPTVASCMALVEEFERAGVAAGFVVGNTPHRQRDRLYAALEHGQLQVLVNVMVATEGWDCPPVSCVLMARPTRLPGLYAQIVGRGLRLSPGKDDCLVLDVVGASRTQKLCRLVDLVPSAEQDDRELENRCPRCTLPLESDGDLCSCQCPDCHGWTNPALARLAGDGCTCALAQGDDEAAGEQLELVDPWRPEIVGYEDVALFDESRLSWLFTRGGLRFLPARDRLVVLWPDSNMTDESETYSAGYCTARGAMDGQWLRERVPLQDAFDVAEDFAAGYDPTLVSRDSRWRKGWPSEAQLAMARRCRIADPEQYTKGQLSDEISIAIASQRLDRMR